MQYKYTHTPQQQLFFLLVYYTQTTLPVSVNITSAICIISIYIKCNILSFYMNEELQNIVLLHNFNDPQNKQIHEWLIKLLIKEQQFYESVTGVIADRKMTHNMKIMYILTT